MGLYEYPFSMVFYEKILDFSPFRHIFEKSLYHFCIILSFDFWVFKLHKRTRTTLVFKVYCSSVSETCKSHMGSLCMKCCFWHTALLSSPIPAEKDRRRDPSGWIQPQQRHWLSGAPNCLESFHSTSGRSNWMGSASGKEKVFSY